MGTMRILIVKMSSLGDIIHAFPVISYFKERFSHCEIDWVVERSFAELVRGHPEIAKVLTVKTKEWRKALCKAKTWQEIGRLRKELQAQDYDLVLDLQGNCKSAAITYLAKSRCKVGFGRSSVSEFPNLLVTHQRYNPPSGRNIREDYLFLAARAIHSQESAESLSKAVNLNLSEMDKEQLQPVLQGFKEIPQLKVMICAGSYWPNKQMTHEGLKKFIQSFLDKIDAHFFFVWGTLLEKAFAESLVEMMPENSSLLNRVSLSQLQNLMTHMDLIVTMDSLPLHLAGTTKTPTYSIFGASSAQKYQPMGATQGSFQGTCPYGRMFEKRCPILRSCSTGACIRELDGKKVFDHFYKWWRDGRV